MNTAPYELVWSYEQLLNTGDKAMKQDLLKAVARARSLRGPAATVRVTIVP